MIIIDDIQYFISHTKTHYYSTVTQYTKTIHKMAQVCLRHNHIFVQSNRANKFYFSHYRFFSKMNDNKNEQSILAYCNIIKSDECDQILQSLHFETVV